MGFFDHQSYEKSGGVWIPVVFRSFDMLVWMVQHGSSMNRIRYICIICIVLLWSNICIYIFWYNYIHIPAQILNVWSSLNLQKKGQQGVIFGCGMPLRGEARASPRRHLPPAAWTMFAVRQRCPEAPGDAAITPGPSGQGSTPGPLLQEDLKTFLFQNRWCWRNPGGQLKRPSERSIPKTFSVR